jgi:deferrochelatase/peroxidase EfeB
LSFSRGFDGDGQLDQGLAFVSFQRRLSQFLNTQARLAGEPLEEYIVPEAGASTSPCPGSWTAARSWGMVCSPDRTLGTASDPAV